MKNISKTVLAKIKKAKIIPTPKWRFIAMHVLLWLIVLGSVAIGSMAISVIIRIINGAEWDIVRRAGGGHIRSFVLVLPYLWVLLLGLILFVANKLFTKTKKGYRYKPVFVVIGSVIISFVLGITLYFAGAGHAVERGLMQNVGPYAKWQQNRDRMMVVPNRGVLVGKVMQISPKVNFVIIDLNSEKWTVDTTKARFKNNFEPQINLSVGVLGEKTGKDTFRADRVLPWQPKMDKKFNGLQPMSPFVSMEMIEVYE